MYAPDNLAPSAAHQVPLRVSFVGECPGPLAGIRVDYARTCDRLALNVAHATTHPADIYTGRKKRATATVAEVLETPSVP